MKTLILSTAAAKDLDKLPSNAREHVSSALIDYAVHGIGDVKMLKGREGYRLRVGRYRVIFDEDQHTILAIYIGKRETTNYSRNSQEKTMTEPQIIISPAGEELVVLPKADYDAMIAALYDANEDDEDVAIYDARKAELTEKNKFPPALSMAILRGDNRLHAVRKHKGLSQVELASAAGIAQGFLSDLENGRRNLTDPVAENLAKALDVPADWLRS